jgi:predicted kinase
MKMDFEPVFKAKNFFDKIRGKEVQEELVPTKSRSLLERLRGKRKEEILQKKLDKKAEKAALKAAKNAPKTEDDEV